MLVANISPLVSDAPQTVSTLKFASRAKIVKNKPKKMEVTQEGSELEQLVGEVDSLNKKLNDKERTIYSLKQLVDEMKTDNHKMRIECAEMKDTIEMERIETSRLKEREKDLQKKVNSTRAKTICSKSTQTDLLGAPLPGKPVARDQELPQIFIDSINTDSIDLGRNLGQKIRESRKSRQNKSYSIEMSKTEDEDSDMLTAKIHERFFASYQKKLESLLLEFGRDCPKKSMAAFADFEEKVQAQKYQLLRRLDLLQDYTASKQHKSACCALGLKKPDEKSASLGMSAYSKNCLLKQFNAGKDQYLLMWGQTSHGKAGITGKPQIAVPTFMPAAVVKKVALGLENSYAIDSKGQVIAWGKGEHLGVESVDRAKPILVKDLSSRLAVKLACGSRHVMCLTVEGTLFTWVRSAHPTGLQQPRAAGKQAEFIRGVESAHNHRQADGQGGPQHRRRNQQQLLHHW